MNLHDIPANGTRRPRTEHWPSIADWARAWHAFDLGPSLDADTVRIRLADAATYPPRHRLGAADPPTYRYDQPIPPLEALPGAHDGPTGPIIGQHLQDRAAQILADIYAFGGRLYRSDIRQREVEAHLAYRVSPEDYRVLQAYVSVEGGYRGPVYDRERGTMSVMGITVLPSR